MPAPVELKNPLAAQIKKITQQKLNIQNLSPQLSTELDKKAAEIADRLWDVEISKEGLREARSILQRVNIPAAVGARMKDALTGIQSVSQSQDLQKILDENAKMLWAKRTALINAGFSAAEAFDLLKVEIASRKSN